MNNSTREVQSVQKEIKMSGISAQIPFDCVQNLLNAIWEIQMHKEIRESVITNLN